MMRPLNLSRINRDAQYRVVMHRGRYRFVTDFGIVYVVDFEEDDLKDYTIYWFNLTNLEHRKSPGDKKIPQTVICIIEEFFRQNPDIILYLCSSDNGQQAMRSRLFLRWFKGYEQQKRYQISAAEVKGEDGTTDYVALIMPRSHPHLEEVLRVFNEELAMFSDNKP